MFRNVSQQNGKTLSPQSTGFVREFERGNVEFILSSKCNAHANFTCLANQYLFTYLSMDVVFAWSYRFYHWSYDHSSLVRVGKMKINIRIRLLTYPLWRPFNKLFTVLLCSYVKWTEAIRSHKSLSRLFLSRPQKTVLANCNLFALTVWINRLSRIAKTWYIARFSRHKHMAKQKSWRQTTKRPRLCYTNACWRLGTDPGNWCKSHQKWVILVRAEHFRFSHLKSFNLVRGLNDDAAQLNGPT